MKHAILVVLILFGLFTWGHTAPPSPPFHPGMRHTSEARIAQADSPKAEAKQVSKEPAKPDTSVKEIEALKNQLTFYAEQYELVVAAAKQVSLDEHARQHDQALSQQVQIKRLEVELKKLQPAAKN